MNHLSRCAVAVLLTAATPLVSLAQSPSTGTVVDSSHAPVPRAFVRLIGADGGTKAETLTDDAGRFTLADAASCADCRIEASLTGFRTATVAAGPVATLTLDIAPVQSAVVVTPARDAVPSSQSGASITVFSADDIARRGTPTVATLLRETPGAAVVMSGGPGGVTSLFMRGGDSSYTKVLLDGIPLNEPGGTFNFSQLSTLNLARVEVVRGAQSALFGSDAMAGVIQLVTARGAGRPSANASLEFGGLGTSRWQAGASGSRGRADFSVAMSRYDTDGLGMNSAFGDTSVSGAAGVTLSPDASLRVIGRFDGGRAGVPGQTAFGRADADATFDRADVTAGAAFEQRLSPSWRHRLSYGVTRSRQRSVNRVADPDYLPRYGASVAPFTFSDYTYDTENVLTRHTAGWQVDARHTGRVNHLVTAAIDWDGERARLDDRMAKTSLPASRDNVGVTAQHQLVTRRLSVATSVRYERNDSFGAAWVPRVSAVAVVRDGAGGATLLKGNAGTGVKEPTILQSFSPNAFYLGNPDLAPERARTWDIGIEQRLAGDRVRIDAVWFDNVYRQKITTKTVSFSPYRAQFVNLPDQATARGLEASLDIAPSRTLRIAAGYTYVDADAALRRPAHSGFARASWTPTRGSLDIDVRKVGVRADNDFSSLSPSLLESGGEWVWNAAASVRLGARVEAVGRVENAFDRRYMEPLGYLAWGRVWHGGLRVRF